MISLATLLKQSGFFCFFFFVFLDIIHQTWPIKEYIVGKEWRLQIKRVVTLTYTQYGMWELDCEESWAPKNWCFWTVVLEKTLESPLHCKEIQPVHSEGDQPWDFFGRNDAKAETPVLWPPHAKSWLIGKDWCWEGLGAGGKGDDRGWDGWMASPTRWTWVWVNSRSWRWTGRPGVLQFMGLQRVGHNWATELMCQMDS